MPKFRFTAVDLTGQPISDTVQAADESAALENLTSRGLTDIVIGPSADVADGGAVELGEADFLAVAQNLAEIAAAGKPLSGGLRAMSEETPSRRLRRGLRLIADRIDSGLPLDEVFSTRIPGFPPHLAGMILAGLQSGRLDLVIQQSLTYAMRSNALRRRIKFSLFYPFVLMACVAALIVFILVFIVPMFSKVFEGFGTSIPAMTALLVETSNLVVRYGVWLLIAGAAVAAIGWVLARSTIGPARLRRLVCRIPLFGSVLRYSALMEYCHLLAVLIESRMTLPEALRYAGGGVHDADLAEASRRLADDVARGDPFAWTAATMPQFPAVFCQFVKWGERHHAYADALHAAGDVFEGKARVQASLLRWLIEPFIIVGVGMCVGAIIVALFMPMIKLLNDLS